MLTLSQFCFVDGNNWSVKQHIARRASRRSLCPVLLRRWVLRTLVVILSLVAACRADAGKHEAENGLKVVAFGTSFTARALWPEQLEQLLEKCTGRGVTVTKVARAGATSDWALKNLASVVAEKPDVVVIEFYINDAALNRAMLPSTSKENFSRILATLQSDLPEARVVAIVAHPPWGVSKWVRPFLHSYIAAHLDVEAALDLEVIDFTSEWSAFSRQSLEQLVPDGLHADPSTEAGLMVPVLANAIAPDDCKGG